MKWHNLSHFCVIFLLLVVAMGASAQTNVTKHKHGDWYWGLAGGFSQSLAENARGTDFIVHQVPSVNMLLGHNFTPAFGLRFTGGLNMQLSRCSKAAENAMPQIYGNGRYSFKCLTATLSGIFNITNVFFGYEDERTMTWSLLFGGGYLKTFGFDEQKIWSWNKYSYYPINPDGGDYFVGHVGVQCGVRVNEAWNIDLELRTNATDNAYNGVENGNNIDFYLDLMVNFVYHFKNGKQGLRRFREPKREPYFDPVLIDHSRDYTETVRFGESMYTEIPFYAGFYYLNSVTTKRVALVAKFLQRHPEVNLNIVGHPDIIPDEDVEYHHHLAQKRAEEVRDALVKRFQIDSTRLRTSIEDHALQSFKTVREWVPAVNFIMEASEGAAAQ